MAFTPLFTNKVLTSINTDKSVFNGTGFIEGYRLNSSGGTTAQSNTVTTGYIAVNGTDIIRMKGVSWEQTNGYHYIAYYNSSFALLGSYSWSDSDAHVARGIVTTDSVVTTDMDGATIFNMVFSDSSKIAYVRLNGNGSGANMVVTVNERIVYSVGNLSLSGYKSLALNGVNIRRLTINGVQVWKGGHKNWVYFSTTNDGTTIYNGGLGYKEKYRVSSSGSEKELGAAICTGFIPVSAGDVVRFYPANPDMFSASGNAINAYNASFTHLGQAASNSSYGIFSNTYKAYDWGNSCVAEGGGIYRWVVPPAASGVAHIRISLYDNRNNPKGTDIIVTINEEI